MTPAPWLRRNPLLGYLVLTFGISWGGILIVLIATGFNLSTPQQPALKCKRQAVVHGAKAAHR